MLHPRLNFAKKGLKTVDGQRSCAVKSINIHSDERFLFIWSLSVLYPKKFFSCWTAGGIGAERVGRADGAVCICICICACACIVPVSVFVFVFVFVLVFVFVSVFVSVSVSVSVSAFLGFQKNRSVSRCALKERTWSKAQSADCLCKSPNL